MVHLTDHNDFMLIEGDEYLSSPIDLSPKFLWYKPNVTLISGIAWDHINVFPTLESYEDQFRQYIETIVPGGALVYNQDDAVLTRLVALSQNTIRKQGYQTPPAFIDDGITYLETPEGRLTFPFLGNTIWPTLQGLNGFVN